MVLAETSARRPDAPDQHREIRALDLFYRAFGSPGRTPVLIAHGMSYFSYDWIDVATAIATDREVVAFDQRGFGDSSWSPDKDYSIRAFSTDILNVLDHLSWDRAVLIGHSMGGRNAAYFASTHPERTAGMILVDWSPETSPAGSRRVRETTGGLPDAFGSIEEAMAYFGKDAHSPQGTKLRQRFESYLQRVEGGYATKRDTFFRDRSRDAMRTGRAPGLVADKGKLDLWGHLARITCPILVVRGTESDMFAAETVPKVRAANANLRLTEVAAGHDVAGQNPNALLREIRPFLAAL